MWTNTSKTINLQSMEMSGSKPGKDCYQMAFDVSLFLSLPSASVLTLSTPLGTGYSFVYQHLCHRQNRLIQ